MLARGLNELVSKSTLSEKLNAKRKSAMFYCLYSCVYNGVYVMKYSIESHLPGTLDLNGPDSLFQKGNMC